MRSHKRRPSKCHPDKPNRGHGMCKSCYNKWRYRTDPIYREKKRIRARRHYLSNRERYLVKQRQYYKKRMANPAFVEAERKRDQKRNNQPSYREKTRLRGRNYYAKNREWLVPKHRLWQREWRKAHPDSVFNSWLRARYGIDTQEYRQMLLDQKGRCAICGKLPSKRGLFIDHDHKTNRVRGLICEPCNIRLGILEKSEWMEKAMHYLQNPPIRLLQNREMKTQ